MLQNIVTVTNNKFTAVNYQLATFQDGSTKQLKFYAESPATGVISRDNFVAFYTVLHTLMMKEIFHDNDAKTKDIDQLIGNADAEINIFMGKNGVQVEVKFEGQTERKTMTWAEIHD